MVKLHYEFEGSSFADGAGSHKYLMDISEGLSSHYGRMIRQGQIFKIKSISARVFNPNTLVQDVVMAVSGNYVYMSPTGNRVKAWKNAFKATQNNRKLLGLTRTDDYDFRVGLHPDYSTDVGAWGEGVKFNAWVNEDSEPLHLAGHSSQGIFEVWNAQAGSDTGPANQSDGFGTWIARNAGAAVDELDFITNETQYYSEGAASTTYNWDMFSCAFSSTYDSAFDAQDSIGTVTIPCVTEDLTLMCGVLGLNVDTTTSDDSVSQTQDYGLQVVVDVESWSPIFKKRSKKRGRRKGRK